jgi:hypothetical protein
MRYWFNSPVTLVLELPINGYDHFFRYNSYTSYRTARKRNFERYMRLCYICFYLCYRNSENCVVSIGKEPSSSGYYTYRPDSSTLDFKDNNLNADVLV